MEEINVFEDIVQGLKEAIAYEHGTGKARVQKRTFNPVGEMAPSEIKELRQSLSMSQVSFAIVMGVSTKTVEAWEAGTNMPNGPARRFMQALKNDPSIIEKCDIVS